MISDRYVSTPAPRPGWLWCLLLTTFIVGTDEFLVAGVLPEIAEDLRVEEAAAGQLVTVFSLTYALAAPVLAVATARVSRRALIAGGLAVFAVLNVAAALAPSYAVLMTLRVAVGSARAARNRRGPPPARAAPGARQAKSFSCSSRSWSTSRPGGSVTSA